MVASAVLLSSAILHFDPATHTSSLPDGRDVPHVTRILSAVGVATDFDTIAGLSVRLGQAIDERRDIGTAVHADCHAFDDGELVWDTVDARVKPFVLAWDVCRQNLDLEPLVRERQIFHPLFLYTGILDGIYRQCRTGKRILPDFKIGNPEDAACHLQTAAYEHAWLVEHPDEPIDERWAIQLCPQLVVPYRITNYTARPDAWRDFQKFQACLTVYYEQRDRRRPIR